MIYDSQGAEGKGTVRGTSLSYLTSPFSVLKVPSMQVAFPHSIPNETTCDHLEWKGLNVLCSQSPQLKRLFMWGKDCQVSLTCLLAKCFQMYLCHYYQRPAVILGQEIPFPCCYQQHSSPVWSCHMESTLCHISEHRKLIPGSGVRSLWPSWCCYNSHACWG